MNILNSFLKMYLFTLCPYVCIGVCVRTYTHMVMGWSIPAIEGMWRSEDNFILLVLSFHLYIGSGH